MTGFRTDFTYYPCFFLFLQRGGKRKKKQGKEEHAISILKCPVPAWKVKNRIRTNANYLSFLAIYITITAIA